MTCSCVILAGVVVSCALAIWGAAPLAKPCENHFKTLGVSRDATTSQIRKAWHRESLLLHPDKRQGAPFGQQLRLRFRLLYSAPFGSSADDAFIRASRAYEVLSDLELKQAHEAALHQCELEFAAAQAERRSAHQHDPYAGTLLSLRGFESTVNAGLEYLAVRAPVPGITSGLRLLSRGIGGIVNWLEMHGSWQSLPFAVLFVLFLGVTVLPTLAQILWGVATAPFRAVLSALGVTRKVEQRRSEGLKRARERQAEQFLNAKKSLKAPNSAAVPLGRRVQ